MKSSLILMTRVPIPGKTKTRLETHLTSKQCAELHACFIKDIYRTVSQLNVDIAVHYTPANHGRILTDILGKGITLVPQVEGDLGRRMFRAIEGTLAAGYEKCIIIGTDIPALKKEHISGAFEALDKAETVIGPTLDGGYYLIGMKEPHLEVFENTFYGVSTVFDSTLSSIKKIGRTCVIVEDAFDIDTWDDLLYMIEQEKCGKNPIPENTRQFLMTHGLLEIGEEGENKRYGNDT